jgi:poly(3-hydroxybutyrate) depolymerase
VLPAIAGACPKIETGDVEVAGIPVRIWASDAPAGTTVPLIVYWHGTGSNPDEAKGMLGDTFKEIMASGGVIAAMGGTTGVGDNTSTGTWSTGDFEIADQVVACAVKQLPIDTHRIYTMGCSSGGIHAGVMAYQRSGYVAAAALSSGGWAMTSERAEHYPLSDPGHVPNVITAHGPSDYDVVIIDFAKASLAYAQHLAQQGGFAVDCGHQGGHCGAPLELRPAMWQFLKDHPFGVDPEPYTSDLPALYPDYCSVIEK